MFIKNIIIFDFNFKIEIIYYLSVLYIIHHASLFVQRHYKRIEETSAKNKCSESTFSKNCKRENCKNLIFYYNMKELVIEYVGTVFFLFVIIVTGNPLAIGAALALAAYLGGPISGGNYNPAVTLLMVMAGKQKMDTLFTYMIAQFLGAFTVLQLYKRLK
jgi:glycerol uptake facilitator-like aquaporin